MKEKTAGRQAPLSLFSLHRASPRLVSCGPRSAARGLFLYADQRLNVRPSAWQSQSSYPPTPPHRHRRRHLFLLLLLLLLRHLVRFTESDPRYNIVQGKAASAILSRLCCSWLEACNSKIRRSPCGCCGGGGGSIGGGASFCSFLFFSFLFSALVSIHSRHAWRSCRSEPAPPPLLPKRATATAAKPTAAALYSSSCLTSSHAASRHCTKPARGIFSCDDKDARPRRRP